MVPTKYPDDSERNRKRKIPTVKIARIIATKDAEKKTATVFIHRGEKKIVVCENNLS